MTPHVRGFAMGADGAAAYKTGRLPAGPKDKGRRHLGTALHYATVEMMATEETRRAKALNHDERSIFINAKQRKAAEERKGRVPPRYPLFLAAHASPPRRSPDTLPDRLSAVS